jgi:hypothetical protein
MVSGQGLHDHYRNGQTMGMSTVPTRSRGRAAELGEVGHEVRPVVGAVVDGGRQGWSRAAVPGQQSPDAAAAHRNAIPLVVDGSDHEAAARLIEQMLQGGNSVRRD